jgi:hypothetical protein
MKSKKKINSKSKEKIIRKKVSTKKKNNITPLQQFSIPIKKSGYEWGLGIEHEFIPVIQIKNFKEYKDLYKALNGEELNENNPDIKELIKEMSNIKNTFNFNIPVFYPHNFIENKFPFANMEWTGDKHFLMLETKNMNYKNITLNKLLEELNKNTSLLLEDYNNNIKKYFKSTMKSNSILEKGFIEPDAGSIFYIYQKTFDETMWSALEPKVIYDKTTNLKLGIDTAGSYHFWITLPHLETDDHKLLHQRAAYILQSIEPLLIGVFCSPDPRITPQNKNKLFAGSFRGAVNKFANYGTSILQNYDDPILFNRLMHIKNIQQPSQINSDHYIFQIRNKYFKKDKQNIYNDKLTKSIVKPNYIYLDDKLEKKNLYTPTPSFSRFHNSNNNDKLKKYTIGLNIRRKPDVKGFEFRIMDHLPEAELPNLAKIIYLFACMSYEISNTQNNLILASNNKGWNTMIANSLLDGYKAKIDKDYINFIENQFNIKLNIFEHKNINMINLMEILIDKCWEKVSKNNKNGLWLILGDDKNKPSINSKNKTILDNLLKLK